MPTKTVTATVSISTNPAVAGRYFVDVRDTTGGANRQVTTVTTDTPAAYLAELTTAGIAAGVRVTTIDDTGEADLPPQQFAYVYGQDRPITIIGPAPRPRWAPVNHGRYVKVQTTETRPRTALVPASAVRGR